MTTPRLTYATTAVLRRDTAQALQIRAMGGAFHRALDGAFRLMSPAVEDAAPAGFEWRRIESPLEPRARRYVTFAAKALAEWRRGPREPVFTRDVGVAAAFRAAGADVAYEIHNAFSTRPGRALFRLVGRRVRVVAISEALKRHVVERHGLEPHRVLVAHDGVDLIPYDALRGTSKAALRRELGLPENRFLVVHTGSLYEGRGVDLFHYVLDAFPQAECVSVGGRPGDVERWRARFRGRDRIRFVPHEARERVVRYQMAADALLFPMTRANPIWWCTSPLKLFEYMASGTPIVGSAIGSSGEILDEKVGFIFDPERPATLRDAVAAVAEDAAEAAARARAAEERVRRHHTWDGRASAIVRFMEAAHP